ncbi:RadC family protein [Rariglobus hedericola]|uniref:JAB domain-containing protein n=1 Tax=Rariglobus hedericola TaxID=2597822 RepID=A0A556QQW6_9BACT|nr:DNA repair protein RadC [Rariglobus hedericola]TSJ79034.1 JAB domain-containing protein [Rariglobus hedericola]
MTPPTNRLQTLATGDRPQERLEKHGAGVLSDSELLAMLLRSGTKGHDVLTLSNRLIAEAGSLAGLIQWRETDFKKLKGIGRVKALQLITVMEVARRILAHAGSHTPPLIDSADKAAEFLRAYTHGLVVEKFWVLCLNRKNRLIKCVEITSGTASATLAHPREVFREAIKESASAIICAHNHPSGDPTPSSADIKMTRQLRDAGQTVDITLLDHVVLGQTGSDPSGLGYYSFRSAGLI